MRPDNAHRMMDTDMNMYVNLCRREKLFIPDGNESTKNQEFVREYFPSLARSGVIYLEREDGSDVLTPEAFNKALTIHQKVWFSCTYTHACLINITCIACIVKCIPLVSRGVAHYVS